MQHKSKVTKIFGHSCRGKLSLPLTQLLYVYRSTVKTKLNSVLRYILKLNASLQVIMYWLYNETAHVKSLRSFGIVINVQKETAETVWFYFKILHMTAITFWSLCILWFFIKYRLPKSNCSHLLLKRFAWTVTQYFYFFTQKVTFFISTFLLLLE